MGVFLSKSKYLIGIQCPKLLWHHYNAKDELPPVDAGTEAIFEQGHEVGELAKKLYPDGIQVKWDQDFGAVIEQSRSLLNRRKPLFEAGFRYNGTYARADILRPAGDGKWDIVEVKSSTSVKPVHNHDLAFQKYCFEGAGIGIGRCCLMHINSEYVRRGDIVPAELLIKEDITGPVREYAAEVEGRVASMLDCIGQENCPAVDIGGYCDDPYPCVLKEKCWKHVRAHEHNVFEIGYIGARAWELYARGIVSTNDIPSDFALQNRHRLQIGAARTGQPHIDSSAVRAFLKRLVYPLHFLDFETFGTAIPLLDGTRPFRQVAFQFSLHIVGAPDAAPKHHSWLWGGTGDPRPEMLALLKNLLGTEGSVVAYNAGFENKVLRYLAESYPEYGAWAHGIRARVVDLLGPFRSFAVYYPRQHGSASLKEVLPALTGKGYDDMAISDGGQASQEFLRVMFTEVDDKERQKVRQNLQAYCGLDTGGMVAIVDALRRLQ